MPGSRPSRAGLRVHPRRPALLLLCVALLGIGLPLPAPALAESAVTLRPAGAGFFNAWALAGPADVPAAVALTSRDAAARAALGPGPAAAPRPRRPRGVPALAWRFFAAPAEVLSLPRLRGRGGRLLYAHADFELGAPFDGLLKVGGTGDLALWLDGKPLPTGPPRSELVVDDNLLPVRLAAGRHRLLLRLHYTAAAEAPGFAVRLHDAQNRPPAELRLMLPVPPAADGLVPLFAAKAAFGLGPAGPRVRLTLTAPGLVPDSAAGATLQLGGAPALATPPPRNVSTAELVAGVALEVALPHPAAAGSLELRLATPAGARLAGWTWPYALPAALQRGHAALTAALAPGAAGPASVAPPHVRDTLAGWLAAADERLAAGLADGEVARLVGEAHALLPAVQRGADPFLGRTGTLQKYHRSRFDGRYHPYLVHVPAAYRPRAAGAGWPLIVALHGQRAALEKALKETLGGFGPRRSRRRAVAPPPEPPPEPPALIAVPGGYGQTGSRYFGRDDVFAVIRAVRAAYAIDPRRIALTGHSLGGLGTVHLGLRHPDRFSMLAPVAGYASVRLYADVTRRHPLYAFEPPLLDRADDTLLAPNGRALPLHAVHGTRDNPEQLQGLVDAYRRLGQPVRFDLHRAGHDTYHEAYADGRLVRALAKAQRPERPAEVVFVSPSPRARSAYWLRIDGSCDVRLPAEVRGRVVAPGAPSAPRAGPYEVRVTTRNVAALTLRLAAAPLPETGAPLNVRLDGGPPFPFPARPPAVHFVRAPDGLWRPSAAPTARAGTKRPRLSGPFDDFRYDPHVFVYGTADPLQTDVTRRRALEDARYGFLDQVDVRFPVKADSDVTPADVRDRHLALYGNPQSNRVLARIVDRLPVKFQEGALVFAGERFEGPDVGLAFVYPNPENPARYVIVLAGTTWRGTLFTRHLPQWLPDYVVFDGGIRRDVGGRLLRPRQVRRGGYFDAFWQVP